MSPTRTFELLRFEATPVSATVALVELDGHFDGPAPERPRLRVEADGVASEHPAVQAGGTPWSAVFAIPLDALAAAAADFDLVPGRGPLVALPTPTTGSGDADRFVELARSANELRHRLGEATEAAASADEHLAAVVAERDAFGSELEALRDKLAAAETRVEESHAAALEAREAQAGAEGEAEQAEAALARAREEARTEVQAEIAAAHAEAEAARTQLTEAQDRQIAAEDEARAARHDLVETRARIEALVREQRTARLDAARTQVAAAARRATDEAEADFRASRLGGPDWRGEGRDADDEDPTIVAPADAEEAPDEEAASSESPNGRAETADQDTAALEPVAGDAATTLHLRPVEQGGGPVLWKDDEESAPMLRPRTIGARRLPAVRPLADPDEDEDVPDPTAVVAAPEPHRNVALAILTSPRTVVAAIFVLLIVALVLIISGSGPV